MVAWDFVSISKQSINVTIEAGSKVVTIVPEYPETIEEWCALKGISIKRGRIHLFKCVSLDGKDFHSGTIDYLQKNKDIIDPLFDRKFEGECGKGLHLADSPEGARYFAPSDQGYLLLGVSARAADCIPHPGLCGYPMKLRARACRFAKVLERVER